MDLGGNSNSNIVIFKVIVIVIDPMSGCHYVWL